MGQYLAYIIGGGIIGLGMLVWIWRRLARAEDDKARADTLESAGKGEVAASTTEAALIDAKEKAEHEKPTDPTDWK